MSSGLALRRPGICGSWRNLCFGLSVAGALALSGCAPIEGPAPESPAQFDVSGRVNRVVDGDTFWLSTQRRSIRIWGLDAPEFSQRGGSAATARLSSLIAGRQVQCRIRDVDRYGRIVGQCFTPDGRDIAATMIASGTAREYCRFSGNYYRTC